jgi:N-acetylmuramoyl-L-alanine amidase/uncharacterized lipoprotein YddW (UPF0748 family)
LQSSQSEFRAFFYNALDNSHDISEILNFAQTNGFKAVFLKVATSSNSVYPSRYLENVKQNNYLEDIIKKAHDVGIRIYAVVDVQTLSNSKTAISSRFSGLTQNGKWNLSAPQIKDFIVSYTKELVENYNLNGIVFDNFWYNGDIDDSFYTKNATATPEEYRRLQTNLLATSLIQTAKQTNPDIYTGLAVPSVCVNYSTDSTGSKTYGDESFSKNFLDIRNIITTNSVDFVCPKMTHSIADDDYSYVNIIEWWTDLVTGTDVSVMPFLMTDYVGNTPRFDKYEIVNQIQLNRNVDCLGHVLYSYNSLVNTNVLSVIAPLYKLSQVFDMTVDLSLDNSFKVTQPSSKNVRVTYSDYYIAGTCNPNEVLYLNDEEVSDVSEKGVFGVFVKLEDGENLFTLTQGNKSIELVINKKEPTNTSDTVNVYSMFPNYDDFVYCGDTVKVYCKGPEGGEISAKIGDETFNLTQETAHEDGTATFVAEVELKNYKETETTNLGKIVYTLNLNGKQKEYKSTGRIFYVGKNSRAAVECIEELGLGTLYKKPDSESDVSAYIYTGVREYVTGSSGNFFILQSGGYISKASVDPVAGKIDLSNKVDGAGLKVYEDYEKITLNTKIQSPFTAFMDEDYFYLTLYNTKNNCTPSFSNSKVIKGCEITENKNSTTYKFSLKGDLWGYHVDYLENKTQITLKYPPKKSANPNLPLDGITVVVDPGHGNEDPGALGPAAEKGACEKDLNMAVSAQLKLELEKLGAKVYVTRTTDIRVDFEGRLGFADSVKPDFFISIHHNATAINADSGKSDGFEIYYHWYRSENFADNLYNSVISLTNKTERGVHYADYRVTRMYYAPSVLVECGFMLHPTEYSTLINKSHINLTAKGLAQGLLKTVEEIGK